MRSIFLASGLICAAQATTFYFGTSTGQQQEGFPDYPNLSSHQYNILIVDDENVCKGEKTGGSTGGMPNDPWTNWCGDVLVKGTTYTLKGDCGKSHPQDKGMPAAGTPYADLWLKDKKVGQCVFEKGGASSCLKANPQIGLDLRSTSVTCSDQAPEGGYNKGRCSAHVTQHQKNEKGIGNQYAFSLELKDGKNYVIKSVDKQAVDGNKHLSIGSPLPYTLEIQAPDTDNEPVKFSYASQSWVCDQGAGDAGHECTLGKGKAHGYQDGDREGDFHFDC